jgi:2,4-dienoyl-CoA reductase-like NADH-dependent reductase (Old Yellow Enzyme family)
MRVQRDFVAAARRALAAGFEWLELHFAHGYLAQSFFSPIANKRTDEYGGSFDNRARFLLDTLSAVREVWPDKYPLTIRLGVSDFTQDSQPLEESIQLVKNFKQRGFDLIDVSLGFNSGVADAEWGAKSAPRKFTCVMPARAPWWGRVRNARTSSSYAVSTGIRLRTSLG